jgi:hypothetical protein
MVYDHLTLWVVRDWRDVRLTSLGKTFTIVTFIYLVTLNYKSAIYLITKETLTIQEGFEKQHFRRRNTLWFIF